jgi:hypothetical protein
MGDGAELAPDSFLMKGEEVPERARWGGNPAAETREAPYQPAALAYEAQRDRSGLQAQSNGKMR